MGNLLYVIFNLIGGYLLFQFFRFKFQEFVNEVDKPQFWTFSKHKYVLTVGLVILVGLSIIKFALGPNSYFDYTDDLQNFQFLASIAMSFSISAIWAYYVRRLDIYERERWINIVIVFILAMTINTQGNF